MSTKTKFFKQCDIRSRNDGIWLKNYQPLTKSCSFTYFQSKSCINFCESEFWLKIKWAPNRKFLKKCYFGGRNHRIYLKNDESFTESCSLTHFQLKSCTNLFEFEFQRKTKWTARQKFSKKSHLIGRNNRIWLKNDKPTTESCSLTHF